MHGCLELPYIHYTEIHLILIIFIIQNSSCSLIVGYIRLYAVFEIIQVMKRKKTTLRTTIQSDNL